MARSSRRGAGAQMMGKMKVAFYMNFTCLSSTTATGAPAPCSLAGWRECRSGSALTARTERRASATARSLRATSGRGI